MNVRFATDDEKQKWDDLVKQNPDGGNDLQTAEFAKVKTFNHWRARYIICSDTAIMALEKHIPVFGKLWYIPRGPAFADAKQYQSMLSKLAGFAKASNVFLLSIDPEIIDSTENIDVLTKLGFIKSHNIQVPNTVIIDISGDIDAILAKFSPKTRYNIRAAQKANLCTKVVPINDKTCAEFYALLQETVAGKAYLRKFDYYKNYWQLHDQSDTGFFMFALNGDEVLAMDFITILGDKAIRKDAASPRSRSVRGASALLELEVIKHLQTRGVTTYDLCGCPPSNQIKNPDHPFYGVGVFKTGFNDHVTDYVGCFYLPIKPTTATIWNKYVEKLVKRIYRYAFKDLYY